MERVFFDITIIILAASVLSIAFRLFKQPQILAYITAGILLGPLGLFTLKSTDSLHMLAQVGVTLVLFMLGLELKIKDLKSIGVVAILAGVIQIIATFLGGLFIAILLGFSYVSSLYIAIALTFSSTIIIVKILSDKRDLASLSSKISIGILLIQDFFAVIALIVLSAFSQNKGVLTPFDFVWVGIKGAWFGIWLYIVSKTVLPFLIRISSKSTETLFLFSLAWVFSIAALVSMPFLGFSIEIGGFLAGLALASYSEHFQISARVRPLRDFFITIFFVLLGVESTFKHIDTILIPVLVFSGIVLVGKPFLVMQTLAAFGYKKRTSFLTGINLAQISEFSLILVFLGTKLGHIGSEVSSILTLVAIITFAFSTTLIIKSKKVYKSFEKYIYVFDGTKRKEEIELEGELDDHVVIIGGHQMGQSVLDALEDGEKVVVVDFDPDIVKKLKAKGINFVFGDIEDIDIQEQIKLDKAKMVISTIPDLEDNLELIRRLNHENKKAKIVVMAYETNEAEALYKAGADYVVLPHLAGGRYIAKLIKENHLGHLERFKVKDLAFLR